MVVSVIASYPQWQAKENRDIDKWSSSSLCLLVSGMSVTCVTGLYLCSLDGSVSTLSPVLGVIALSINIQCNTILEKLKYTILITTHVD